MSRTRGGEKTLGKIRRLVRTERWGVTGHARRDIEDGHFALEDVEAALTTGTIRRSQPDEKRRAVDRKKHTVCGVGADGQPFGVVGKILASDEGEVFLAITAYERTEDEGD